MKSLIGLLLVCSTINASEVLPLAAPPTDSSLVTQVTYEEIESFMRNRSLSEEVLQLSGDKGNGGDICEQKIIKNLTNSQIHNLKKDIELIIENFDNLI